ncbi:hypothetical protein CBS101457_005379 [Exobasidium rhododendri]|nr:hypothetical protein CBS101457_005379 [Exobasidium rhododendri]
MSSAHRPTWNPAEGRADERHKSARVAARHMPSHTKLKFRQPQQGGQASNQVNRDDRVRRDLKKELEMAERESRAKRRKEQGLAPEKEEFKEEDDSNEVKAIEIGGEEEDENSKRKKLIEEMRRLDEDDKDSDSGSSDITSKDKGKAKEKSGGGDSSDDSSSEDDDDDEEDDTAALLRELEKIRRERAEEKARQEKERAEMEQSSREDEIALGNPLLNLENVMKGGSAKGRDSNGMASFGVKRRWDDDVVFKNQAAGNEKEKDGFVNDLTRSEFHKRFLQRFIR